MTFKQRHSFIYRAKSHLKAFAIRKANWEAIREEYEYFGECMKINFMYNYNMHIRKPLNLKKEQDIKMYEMRKDYQ